MNPIPPIGTGVDELGYYAVCSGCGVRCYGGGSTARAIATSALRLLFAHVRESHDKPLP